MLPTLVRGVPSMHICLDFAPKLLSHSDIDKQVFAINLLAQLCEKYPIAKTYNGVKLAINVANTILQSNNYNSCISVYIYLFKTFYIFDHLIALTFNDRKRFFSQILTALTIFYTKLPPLTHECMSLIIHAIQTRSLVSLFLKLNIVILLFHIVFFKDIDDLPPLINV